MDQWGEAPCEYEAVDVSGPALTEVVAALKATHLNGGVLLARFRATNVTDPGGWFRAGTFLESQTNVRDLFGSSAVRVALADLDIPDPFPLTDPPRFEEQWGGTLILDGALAATLVNGGAYKRFPGTAAEAKTLALAAVRELINDRHEDFRVFACHQPWTPWFYDVAWDLTWVFVDRAKLEATIMCLTDTD